MITPRERKARRHDYSYKWLIFQWFTTIEETEVAPVIDNRRTSDLMDNRGELGP